MRALTPAEARVIAVLLAARPDSERDRMRLMEVPRSTYHAVRRRAYEEGWLEDRYIPHPVPAGRPFVSFLLARPYADKAEELARLVAEDPGAVLHWTGSQVSLSVHLHRDAAEPRRLLKSVGSGQLSLPPTLVTVRAEGPAIPVYFDFEGLWCHLAGLSGTLAYPHGLGGGADGAAPEPDDEEEVSSRLAFTPHQWWAAGELLRRPFALEGQGRGGHLVGPFGLPFSERRLLERGWVNHRTILDPGRVPPYQGRVADQVVLVTGTPRTGARPEVLFSTLGRDCRVYPFLYVTGNDRWLLGAMGGSGPSPDAPPRRPVLPTLREFLEGIEIHQEAAASFTAKLNHRYDRLLPPPSTGRPPAKR